MPAIAIIEFTMAAFFATLLIGLFSGPRALGNSGISRTCLLSAAIWLFVDATSYVFNVPEYPLYLDYITNLLAYTLGNVVIIVFIRYRELYISKRTELNPWLYRVPILAFVLCTVCIVAEYLMGHIIEYRDGLRVAVYGLPVYVEAIQIAVMVYLPFVALSKRKSIGMKAVLLLGFFDFIPAVSVFASRFFEGDLTVIFSSVEVMLIVTVLQKKETEEHIRVNILRHETETKLRHEHLRSEILNYMMDNDDDPIELLKQFAERIRVLLQCDQIIYRDLEETRIMVNSPEIEDSWAVPISYCMQCYHFDANHPMYDEGYTEMENCQKGWQGIPVYHDCPIKSSLTRIVYCDGETAGYLAIHYVKNYHQFTDVERNTLEEFARIISISLSRYQAKKENRELKLMQRMQAQLEENNLIIGALSEDFGCVNYIVLAEDKKDDTTVNYRTSELLKRLIPGWEVEPDFTSKIKLLNEYVVYEPDKEQFYKNARREKVLANLTESDFYFVNTRLLIDNEIRYYQLKYSAIRENGKIVSMVAGLHSIDDQMKKELQAQEKLAKALEGAQAANKAKTAFLFNMSHDIRTPMNAILGYADMSLRHLEDTEAVSEYLHKLKTSGEHLLNLINDILEMSRIEAGKMELVAEPMDIRTAIERIGNIGQALAVSKSINFEVITGEIRNPYVYADELHIDEVLINILTNAVKYSKDDGKVRFNVSQISAVRENRARFRFVISDNGIGMSEEFKKHIFETFAREKSSTVSKLDGTGLGLSIVQRIIELSDGTIDIQSELNVGTTVTVEMSFGVMYEDAIEKFKNEHKSSLEIGTSPFLKGCRVLLVEDNEMNREIAGDILTEAGMKTEYAEDGSIAVDMFSQKGEGYYDLILMDIQMPVMNGYDAAKAIRRLPGGEGIPIIAVSANAFEDDINKSLESGMNAHIAKPINVDELFRAVVMYM